MPAITSLTISAAAPLGRVLLGLAGRAGRGLKQLAEKVKNRHDAMRLAELDDRMLADIGLNRSDLRDAYALPPWRDPSDCWRNASPSGAAAGGGRIRLACR